MTSTYEISSPVGEIISIPEKVDLKDDIYLKLDSLEKIKNYYQENGYVVIRNLIASDECKQILQFINQELRPYPKHLYRQVTGNPEKHILTDQKYILNSLLNLQDLPSKHFANLKKTALNIFTNPKLLEIIKTILQEPATLVQSMLFEGNPATWAHQDSYYLDSADLGKMIAAWIAIEDIKPGAGRFYIYPKSHLIDMEKNGGKIDIAFNHARYKELIINTIKNQNLKCVAPALNQGDVLIWNSKTIHGSLKTTQPQFSRTSLTAHYIPQSKPYLQYQSRHLKLKIKKINGLNVHCPKDQDKLINQGIFFIETCFPRLFPFVKTIAKKIVTR